jgi:hypothetical protein
MLFLVETSNYHTSNLISSIIPEDIFLKNEDIPEDTPDTKAPGPFVRPP